MKEMGIRLTQQILVLLLILVSANLVALELISDAKQKWYLITPEEVDTSTLVTMNDQWAVSSRYITDVTGLNTLEPFYIMQTEVSCQQFLSVDAGIAVKRIRQIDLICEYYPDEPVTGVSFQEATQYCQQLDAYLPTEEQWLAAVLYKNGNSHDMEIIDFVVNVKEAHTSPSGLQGMLGNVWEMTSSRWGNHQSSYVMKGGAFDLAKKPYLLNPLFKAAYKPADVLSRNIGFRCVK